MSDPESELKMMAERDSEFVKNAVSLPHDGCGNLDIDCPTLSTIYAGLLVLIGFGTVWDVSLGQMILVVSPFLLFLVSGLGYTSAVPPNREHGVAIGPPLPALEFQKSERVGLEAHLHNWRWVGTGLFWVAILISISVVMFFSLRRH
jgi:hypothetical protein